jgi:hypothetical protein
MTTNKYLINNSSWQYLLSMILLLSPAAMFATTYEAEAAANKLGGAAGIYACTPCSGGADVGYLGKGSTLQFNGVNGGGGGQAQIVLSYANGTTSTLTGLVSINGAASVPVNLPPTGGWWTTKAVTLTATLAAGAGNSVSVGNSSDWVPDIDKLDVTPAAVPVTPAPKPTPTPTPAPVPSGNTIGLASFGSAGKGGDDTSVIQLAINSTAVKGQRLEIPASSTTYNVRPLTIPSNANILLDAGVIIEATSGYGITDRMINLEGASNVAIAGTIGSSTFIMRKSEYTSGEYRHCLSIDNSLNVTISGINCNNSGGDGLYISGTSSNITVNDSTFDNNRRQGFSLISGNGIFINRCHFTNTNGTLPQDGIDMEPNGPTDQLTNVNIVDSFTDGNAGNGIAIDTHNLNSSTHPVSVTILRHNTDRNALSGYFLTNELSSGNGVSGAINVTQSASTLDGGYGAVASFYDSIGAAATFQNLTVTNSNQSGSNYDGAAIAVKRGGGGIGLQGNVHVLSATISDTTSKLATYFAIEDFSNVGSNKIQFLSPVKLSSSAGNLPFAVVNGSRVSSVNIQ